MARSTYLGTASDMLLVKRGSSLSASSKAGVLRFWDAETGGNQYTNLRLNGAAVTEVPVPAGTLIAPAVELPDGVDGGAWVEWVLDGETAADSREFVTPSRPLEEAKAHTDAAVAGLAIPSTAADVGADPAGTAQGLVDALKANAPAAYDTLVEIASKLNADDDVTAQLLADVADKVDTADLDTLVAAEAQTDGSELKAVLSASYAAPEAWDRFDDKLDGDPGADRFGRDWILYGGSVGPTAYPQVIGGRLTSAVNPSASYAQLVLEKPVRRIGGKFSFGPNATDNGSVVLIAWANPYAGGSVPDASLHLAIKPTGWVYGVWSGNVMTQVKSGTFSPALTADDATEYACEVHVDAENATATILLPDGNVAVVSHALIGSVAAEVAGWETYQQASTDTMGAWSHVWADSRRSEALPVARALALTRGLPFVTYYAPSPSASVAAPTSATDVDATNLSVTFTLPGDCTAYLLEMEGNLSVSSSARVFWSHREGTTTYGTQEVVNGTMNGRVSYSHKRTGLAPGSTHTLVWKHWSTVASAATLLLDGPNGRHATMKVTPLRA